MQQRLRVVVYFLSGTGPVQPYLGTCRIFSQAPHPLIDQQGAKEVLVCGFLIDFQSWACSEGILDKDGLVLALRTHHEFILTVQTSLIQVPI